MNVNLKLQQVLKNKVCPRCGGKVVLDAIDLVSGTKVCNNNSCNLQVVHSPDMYYTSAYNLKIKANQIDCFNFQYKNYDVYVDYTKSSTIFKSSIISIFGKNLIFHYDASYVELDEINLPYVLDSMTNDKIDNIINISSAFQ